MAKFECRGIEAQIAKFDGLAAGTEEACRRAVDAGGKLLADRLKEAAPVRTGGLQRSIKAGKLEYSPGDGWHAEVKPQGKDGRGEPYAKIGNVLEYGHGRVPPRPWFLPAVARSESEVIQAMREAFTKEQAK
ncbi:MAG: HK97 gp10 family phage protein [Clostridia bacterium]|nr:HK97 gp10 family phage protein [Clostridia bacterium]